MIDPSAQAFTAQGIYKRGVACTFQRLAGQAPNITVAFSAAVVASIETVTPDTEDVARTGYSSRNTGSLTQDDRLVIVMAADLAAFGFPIPPEKGDKIVISPTVKFTVSRVDPYKRAMAGAIELVATGVP